RGLHALHVFVRDYAVALLLAVVGAALGSRRSPWLLLAGGPLAPAYVVSVGGDTLAGPRFLAAPVPPLFPLAAAALATIASGCRPGTKAALLSVFSAAVFAGSGLSRPAALLSRNGHPREGTIAGVLIGRQTRPEATLAVFAAGAAPYFSHRRALGMLWQTGRRLARPPPAPPPERGRHNQVPTALTPLAPPHPQLPPVPPPAVDARAE